MREALQGDYSFYYEKTIVLLVKQKGNRYRHRVIGIHADVLTSLKVCSSEVRGNTLFYSSWNDVSAEWVSLLNAGEVNSEHELQACSGAIDCVLSNHFCRFLVVPWSDAFFVQESMTGYLRAIFSEVYGDAGGSLDYVCQDAAYGQPRVVCGVEHDFLNDLKIQCSQNQLRFNTCRPYLDVAFEYFLPQMRTREGIFVLVEKNMLSILAWDKQGVLEVDHESYEEKWCDALGAWLERNLLMRNEAKPVHIACPPSWRESSEEGREGWHYLEWKGKAKDLVLENPHFALTVCLL